MKKLLLFSIVAAVVLFAGMPAMAQEAAQHAANTATGVPYGAIAGALGLAFAAAFGAIGQGKAIVAACEGTARNPGATGNIRTTLMIGLAFIESLVLYMLLISFMVMGK